MDLLLQFTILHRPNAVESVVRQIWAVFTGPGVLTFFPKPHIAKMHQ